MRFHVVGAASWVDVSCIRSVTEEEEEEKNDKNASWMD